MVGQQSVDGYKVEVALQPLKAFICLELKCSCLLWRYQQVDVITVATEYQIEGTLMGSRAEEYTVASFTLITHRHFNSLKKKPHNGSALVCAPHSLKLYIRSAHWHNFQIALINF